MTQQNTSRRDLLFKTGLLALSPVLAKANVLTQTPTIKYGRGQFPIISVIDELAYFPQPIKIEAIESMTIRRGNKIVSHYTNA